jgi:hypothetical protein
VKDACWASNREYQLINAADGANAGDAVVDERSECRCRDQSGENERGGE